MQRRLRNLSVSAVNTGLVRQLNSAGYFSRQNGPVIVFSPYYGDRMNMRQRVSDLLLPKSEFHTLSAETEFVVLPEKVSGINVTHLRAWM